jgi:hypothetical protein
MPVMTRPLSRPPFSTDTSDHDEDKESYVDGPGSGKPCLLSWSPCFSATEKSDQSRPKPFGNSTAWSSSTLPRSSSTALHEQLTRRIFMDDTYINTITHGDCLNILPQLAPGSVNFVLTDPPYITNYKSCDGRKIANDNNDAWLRPAFAELHRVLARDSFRVSFYGWPHADKFLVAFRAAGFRVVGHLTFPKRCTSSTGFLRAQHEDAYLLAKGRPTATVVYPNSMGDSMIIRHRNDRI